MKSPLSFIDGNMVYVFIFSLVFFPSSHGHCSIRTFLTAFIAICPPLCDCVIIYNTISNEKSFFSMPNVFFSASKILI